MVRRGFVEERWLVMARLARVEVFAADEIAIVHVMNRTVRRCFLPGDDPVSRKFAVPLATIMQCHRCLLCENWLARE